MSEKSRFAWPVQPAALQKNVVSGDKYRFTLLTDSLIRLEYSPTGTFEDRASQTVFFRDFEEADFLCSKDGAFLRIETAALELHYRENELFSGENLWIKLKAEPASAWHYGDDFEDLGGTARTLDNTSGPCALDRGVCSRNGFSVLDDSHTMLLGSDGWVEVREENTLDLYFFGYGFRYLDAVRDFYRLTGAPPMLPAYALGNWWSRYYAYTQAEYCALMDRFQQEDIPFSVGVVDMDWHVTDVPEDQQDGLPAESAGPFTWPYGWTGYTWNEALFPDYKAFLRELKEKNLHVALNLHPASGIRRHEAMYREMAESCGVDPASGKRIFLDILSQEFMEKYFDIVHHPYENDGVDFWWMDWQQGTDYAWIHAPNREGEYQDPRERMDPLWLLNHLHITDISRNGKRPMFFSRYAGPGSHRYPVGFSGDTFVTWDSLAFQPYFTATASNIGYSWWSHDIGGHMKGYRDEELFIRWIQLGVFSPINRLHSTNSEFQGKEPWNYGMEAACIAKQWLRFRHSLFPYLYTMNYRNHSELLPLVQPMYYTHPKCSCAYEVPNQFWFGSELMVAPITEKNSTASLRGSVTAWLPQGDWFDFFTGLHYASRGRKLQLHRKLETMPVLAKAGAIVPMARYQPGDNRLLNAETMDMVVFPGKSNTFTLYEDAGEGMDYQQGAYTKTPMTLAYGETAVFTIHPALGDGSLIPQERSWNICLRGFYKDVRLCVLLDGICVPADISYSGTDNTFAVCVCANVTQKIEVVITGEQLIHDNRDVIARCKQILLESAIGNDEKDYLAKVITSGDTLHTKMMFAQGRSTQTDDVVKAVKELLSLTEDEYTGQQTGSCG